MITQQYQYQLARRGKWICPECGRKTFVCYVDADGHVLDESVGKCDRADHCAHHYTPRQYFEDHQAMGIVKPRRHHQPMYQVTPKPIYIDNKIFKQSCLATMSNHNNLVDYLKTVFGVEIVNRMVHDYYIGTSRHWSGSTVFFQVDRYGKVRRGKIMLYNPTNGKRVKYPNGDGVVTSVHKVMELGEKPPQCLFGEHLLRDDPGVTVAVVESEKTAIILSVVLGDCIAVACGGCGMLTAAMCEPLRGRDVILIPDNGQYTRHQNKKGEWHDGWSEKGKQMRHIFGRLRIADIMEREAINPGDDIGDLVLQRYAEWCATYPGQDIPIDLGLTDL